MTTETLQSGQTCTPIGAGYGGRMRAALKRFGASVIAGQERRARALAGPYLVRHSDEALLGAGFTASEIAALRRTFGL